MNHSSRHHLLAPCIWIGLTISSCCQNTFAQALEFIYADSMESMPAVVYRNTQLALRDPHVFVDVPVFGCVDFTDTPIPVANVSFNGSLADMLTMDGNADNLLDLSILQALDRFDPQGIGQMVNPLTGVCAAPFPPDSCSVDPITSQSIATSNVDFGLCLQSIVGTTSGYTPSVPVVQDACFISAATDSQLLLGDVNVPLLQTEFAFGWSGNQLMPGLNLGFLREVDADTALLPANLPVIGGQPLSSILPGGQGSCAAGDDRDMFNGDSGWWFYTEAVAEQVTISTM